MTRWGFVLGALALLLVFVGTRASGSSSVTAQTDTAAPAADATTDPAATDPYQDFLAKLATNLGVADAAQVDAAIRTTLKQTVDERLAVGDLSANDATAIKERIDAADVPLGMLGGRHGGFARDGLDGPFGGHDRGDFARGGPGGPFEGRDRDDRRDSEDDATDQDDPADTASGLPETEPETPTATPAASL